MLLRDWLTAKRIPTAAFASRLGIPVRTLYRYVNHERIPRPSTMGRIVEETAGEVQPNDFFAPPAPPEQKDAAA